MTKRTALANISIDPDKLRALRRSRGLTQEQLAKAIGTQSTAICRMERKPFIPRVGTLEKLCRFFEITPEDIAEPRATDAVQSIENTNNALGELLQTLQNEASSKDELLKSIDVMITMLTEMRNAIVALPETMLIKKKAPKQDDQKQTAPAK